MRKKKLDIWNTRMMLLMQHCIAKGLCETQKEFLQAIGAPTNSLPQIRAGEQGFRISHIVTAAKKYKVNIAWIMGMSEELTTKGAKRSAFAQLEDAVLAVKAELV